MKRSLLLFVLTLIGCGSPQTTVTTTPDPHPHQVAKADAGPDDLNGGMCTAEPAPCNNGNGATDAGSDAKLVAPDAPLPPPKPATIPLSKGPTDKIDAQLKAGDEAFEKNDYAAAETKYKEAAGIAPKHPGPIVGLARVRIGKTGLDLEWLSAKGNKEVDAAIKDLKRATQLEDTYGPAFAELGRALLMVGDGDAAVASLVKATQLLPNDPETHSALAVAQLATGHKADALAPIARATDLDMGNPTRHRDYGTVLLMLGKSQDAVKEYRLAVKISPDDPRARSDLGLALLGANDVTNALKELERAIALDPKRATFHSNYGYALQIKGDVQQAIAEYRAAIKLDDKLASAWINLATALAKSPSTRKEARAALEKAKALDPSDPRVKANLNELDALEKGH